MNTIRLANERSVGPGRALLLAGIAGACLMGPGIASAVAVFDFAVEGDANERGYVNGTYSRTDDGLTLEANAFEDPGRNPSHIYLDGKSGGRYGGMGVCTDLDVNNQCVPSSDDNVSIDAEGQEILQWVFSEKVFGITLTLRDSDHYLFDGTDDDGTAVRTDSGIIQVDIGGTGTFVDVPVDVFGSNIMTLDFGNTGQRVVEFKAKNGTDAGNFANHFYIATAEISTTPNEIPVPAAVWLFASGLLGMVGVARRKKA